MKAMMLVSIMALLLYSVQLYADELEDANTIFDWAEVKYPQFFSPSGVETFNIAGYTARYYSGTNVYVGVKDGGVYVYSKALFSGLKYVETVQYFLKIINTAPNFRVLATNGPNGNVIQWDGVTGEFLGDFIPKGIAQSPSGIDVGPDGYIYVIYNGALFNDEAPSIHSFSIDGDHLGEYASLAGVDTNSSTDISDIEFDGEGNLYVLDIGSGYGSTEVFRLQGPAGDEPGAFIETFLTPELIDFQSRRMVSYDMETGPDGNLYFGSVGSHDILRFKTPGGEDFGWYGEQLIGSWQNNPENPLDYIQVRDIFRSHTWDTHPAYPGIRPFGIDWDENGHLFVVADELTRDPRMLRIIELDEDGNYIGDIVSAEDGIPSDGRGYGDHFREADFGPDGNLYVVAMNYPDTDEIWIFGDPSGPQPGKLLGKLAVSDTVSASLSSITFLVK